MRLTRQVDVMRAGGCASAEYRCRVVGVRAYRVDDHGYVREGVAEGSRFLQSGDDHRRPGVKVFHRLLAPHAQTQRDAGLLRRPQGSDSSSHPTVRSQKQHLRHGTLDLDGTYGPRQAIRRGGESIGRYVRLTERTSCEDAP
jgi:hypothetical protein